VSFPNYPDKYDAPAYLTPEVNLEPSGVSEIDAPEAIVLCYQPSFFEYILREHAAKEIDMLYDFGQLYSLADTDGGVGVLGEFGVGAPATAIHVERLIARGTEVFCIVGGCAGLGGNVARHEPVVCDRAIRDEGVSHHYLPSERYAHADEALTFRAKTAVDAAGFEPQVGASWTTDAFFRETVPEIEHYRDEGVLTVEMEAAAVFALAEYRDVDAAALLCPFDLVLADGWEPEREPTVEGLRDLLAPAREALVTHVEAGSGSN
jgi:uridine phosphorylase